MAETHSHPCPQSQSKEPRLPSLPCCHEVPQNTLTMGCHQGNLSTKLGFSSPVYGMKAPLAPSINGKHCGETGISFSHRSKEAPPLPHTGIIIEEA